MCVSGNRMQWKIPMFSRKYIVIHGGFFQLVMLVFGRVTHCTALEGLPACLFF